MYEKVDTFGIFSQKFVGLDDEGQDRLVKATLHLFDAQKAIKNDAASKNKGNRLEKKQPGKKDERAEGVSFRSSMCMRDEK
jgi:hypothetical protein